MVITRVDRHALCILTAAEPPDTVSLNTVQPFGNELIRNLGDTISARCLGGRFGQWLSDGSDLIRFNPALSISPVTESNAGFYQCLVFILSFPEFEMTDTVATFYALIQGNFL